MKIFSLTGWRKNDAELHEYIVSLHLTGWKLRQDVIVSTGQKKFYVKKKNLATIRMMWVEKGNEKRA